jgi:hypothetical protein
VSVTAAASWLLSRSATAAAIAAARGCSFMTRSSPGPDQVTSTPLSTGIWVVVMWCLLLAG